jgi:hypothetical protein
MFLAMWVLWSLLMRIITEGLMTFPRPKWCLLSLLVLACLGFAYQVGTIMGAYKQDDNLTPLFTDLPQLCLITCITITGGTWDNLIAVAKRKSNLLNRIFSLVFLISLYVIFIGLMVASATTNDVRVFTCASTEDEKSSFTTSQAIIISYKAIYAFYTFIIACVYLLTGVRVINFLRDSKFKEVLAKSGIATFIATLSLFITVAISLYSVEHTLSNTTKLAFTISVLILPSYSLAYLFSYNSDFLSIDFKRISKTRSKTKSVNTANTSTQNNSSNGDEHIVVSDVAIPIENI